MNSFAKASLLPLAIVGTPIAGHAIVYLTPEQAQAAVFPGVKMTDASIRLTAEQKKRIEALSGVRQRKDDVKAWRVEGGGWFVVDEVIGKHEYITFAVGITKGGEVKGIEILEYRET